MDLFELNEHLDFIGLQTYESIYDFDINDFIERVLQIIRDMATANQHCFLRYLDNCQELAVENVIVQDFQYRAVSTGVLKRVDESHISNSLSWLAHVVHIASSQHGIDS